MSQLDTGYGHFSDDGLEYAITRPETLRPGVKVINNGDYDVVLSEAGSGTLHDRAIRHPRQCGRSVERHVEIRL